jgi:hypothetical protein
MLLVDGIGLVWDCDIFVGGSWALFGVERG